VILKHWCHLSFQITYKQQELMC